MSLYENWVKEFDEQRRVKIQETLDKVNAFIAEEIAERVEEVAEHYVALLTERDREIFGLRTALEQSAKDFRTLQERLNGNQPSRESGSLYSPR